MKPPNNLRKVKSDMEIKSYKDALSFLQENLKAHVPSTSLYSEVEMVLKQIGQLELKNSIEQNRSFSFSLLKGNEVLFPFVQMGAVSTVDLLRVDEIIMFAFYVKNMAKYDIFFDLGANLGLHTLVVAGLGGQVIAYEPDKVHYGILSENVLLNNCQNVECRNAAIGDSSKDVQFVRVLGNTTSSHVKGEKANPYGALEEFTVKCDELNSQLNNLNKVLLKIDIEGMEAALILSITKPNWQKVDAFVEVGTEENARAIFEYCMQIDLKVYAQQSGWAEVTDIKDMPANYKDGSIFLTNSGMTWS